MSPLVAVQFTDPKREYNSRYKFRLGTISRDEVIPIFYRFPSTGGVLINIECRAWAKNIVYKNSAQLREGSVHFELQVDEPK